MYINAKRNTNGFPKCMFYLNEVSEDSNVICNWFKTFFQFAYAGNTLNICNNSDVTTEVEIGNIDITELDVEQALSSLKNIIEPGSDGIDPTVLKKLLIVLLLSFVLFI